MADNKPIDTGKKTVTGRTIWRDPETGQDYSERSTTFEIDGIYYTMPTVAEDGSQYTDDQIRDYVKKYGASDYLTGEELPEFKSQEDAIKYAISRSDTRKQKEEPMLQEQMLQFNEGGLRDEGGQVDEVSGNEVPIGGTRKGVRDDVPAMISEGEFIFPEDVTRYIGLDKLMQLRQEAKMGLKRMEAMGQMGNSDEATIPDDMPFSMADLIIVGGDTGKELEMNEGGVAPEFSSVRRLSPVIERPEKQDLSFKTIMGDAYYQVKMFKNAEGVTTFIGFVGDNPVYPIPEGFTLYDPTAEGATDTEETKTVEEVNEVLSNVEPRDPKSPFKDNRSEFTQKGSWSNSSLNDYINEAKKFTNGSSSIATAVASLGGPLMAGLVYNFSNKEKQNILSTIDARMKGASPEQLTELKSIKGILEKKLENKSILGKIAGFVGNLFAPDEVKQKISNDAEADAGVNDKNNVAAQTTSAFPARPALPVTNKSANKQTTSEFPARLEMNSMEVSPPKVKQLGNKSSTQQTTSAFPARPPMPNPRELSGRQMFNVPIDNTEFMQNRRAMKPVSGVETLPEQDRIDTAPIDAESADDLAARVNAVLSEEAKTRINTGDITASRIAREQATEAARKARLERQNLTQTTGVGYDPSQTFTTPRPLNAFEEERRRLYLKDSSGTDYFKNRRSAGFRKTLEPESFPITTTAQTNMPIPSEFDPSIAKLNFDDDTYNTPKQGYPITKPVFGDPREPDRSDDTKIRLDNNVYYDDRSQPALPLGRNQDVAFDPVLKDPRKSVDSQTTSAFPSRPSFPVTNAQTESAFPSGRPSIDTAPEGTGISDASLQSTLLDTGVSLRPRARPTEVSVADTTAAPSTETRASRTSTTSGVSAANAAAALREEMAAVSDDRRREIERTTASGYTGSTVNGVATGKIAGNGQVNGVVANEDGTVKKTDNGMTVFKDSNGVEYTKSVFGTKKTLDGSDYDGPADGHTTSDQDNNSSSNNSDGGSFTDAINNAVQGISDFFSGGSDKNDEDDEDDEDDKD